MEKEYRKIKTELKELVPIENTINNARNIELLHNLIKNNGQDFNLKQEEIELANKLSLWKKIEKIYWLLITNMLS